jgi:hypothetical protein
MRRDADVGESWTTLASKEVQKNGGKGERSDARVGGEEKAKKSAGTQMAG